MDAIRAALLSDFEPFETDTRCADCGQRLKVTPHETAGFDALCGGCGRWKKGVTATDLDWIKAEFCEPFVETGVPAPRAHAGEIYQI